jgi:pimeloyl-ACP methyl ester carboxylesterase
MKPSRAVRQPFSRLVASIYACAGLRGLIQCWFGTAALAALMVSPTPALATHQWEALPPTPTLPAAETTGFAPVNGVRLFYAVYGHGRPLVLLHGGLANASYWGLQIPALARQYQVIVIDSRGQGRSTRTSAPIGYDVMAADVLALLDSLHLDTATIIGWSDGAIVGLELAIHYPDRLVGLFAFAANSDPSGTKSAIESRAFAAYTGRVVHEYEALSPTPAAFKSLHEDLARMWRTQPHFTAAQLHGIAVRTWIVGAEHDEVIKAEQPDWIAAQIPSAHELILPGVGHFAFLQDPDGFNNALLQFLSGS